MRRSHTAAPCRESLRLARLYVNLVHLHPMRQLTSSHLRQIIDAINSLIFDKADRKPFSVFETQRSELIAPNASGIQPVHLVHPTHAI